MVAAHPREHAVTGPESAGAHPPTAAAVPAGARETVLARIRAALGADATAAPVPRAYRRTGEHAPGTEPVLALLVDRLVDYKAAVHRVSPDARSRPS